MRQRASFGQFGDVPEPAHFLARVAGDQAVDQRAVADGGDRCVEVRRLPVEGADRVLVQPQRLRVGAEFGVRVGHRQLGLEHGRVARIARGQLAPRRQRRLHVALRRGGPPEPQQRLVRQHPGQADTFEVRVRRVALAFLQGREAERDVRLVAQAAELLSRDRKPANLVEHGRAAGDVAAADQRDPEVVARVAARPRNLPERLEHARGLGVSGARHQHVGLQQHPVFLQRARQGLFDARQRFLGFRAADRAGSGSWRDRTRRGRAPAAAHCVRSASRTPRPPRGAGRTTGTVRRAGSRPRRRAGPCGRTAARPSTGRAM